MVEMNVTQVFNTLSPVQVTDVMSKFERLFLVVTMLVIIWFIFTGIVLLTLSYKARKKGTIVTAFIISGLILIGLLFYIYFNVDQVLLWLNMV